MGLDVWAVVRARTSPSTPAANINVASRRDGRDDCGQQFWLWRAVDDEGEVLDLLVQRRRDKAAAVKLMRKLLKKQGFAPEVLVTDKLRSYGAAKAEIGLSAHHEQGLRKNNRAEFASTDPMARAQDAAFQITRISPALSVHSRRGPKHFQRQRHLVSLRRRPPCLGARRSRRV